LLEPFNYIASSQKEGDTLQSLLVEAFNAWMQVPHDKLEHIKKIVFMLHNASLLYVMPDLLLDLYFNVILIVESTILKTARRCDRERQVRQTIDFAVP
jgi:hypothetical protein